MGVSRTVVDVHVLDEATAETVFGEHSLHNADEEGVHTGLEVLVEALLHEDLGGELALAAGIAGEVEVDAVGHLLAGEAYLVGVDDDYVVSALDEGRVRRLVLAAENFRYLGAEAAENLVGGIDNHPLVFNFLSVGRSGLVA